VDVGLRTTTAGWFPKPLELRRARWRHAEGQIDEAALRRAEDAATRDVVTLQEDLGLDLLVEGQMERGDAVTFFAEHLAGMEIGGLVRCLDNRYYRRPRIVGEVGRKTRIAAARWQAVQALTQKPVRAILTGPYTLMDWSFDEHYGSRENCCLALAEAVRAEAAELAAAGAAEIEIAEPAISARPQEMDLAAEALGRVTAGLRGRARTWTYVGYGDLSPVAAAVLALPVDGLILELANSGFEMLDALAHLPADKQLAAGVVDVHSAEVETLAVLCERAERLLARVPADRLWLTPDGPLRALTSAAARAKLEALVQAAARSG
jgi:5-methyltetrahydropteroyltriglutamate--homocysteine methyltransferase